MTARLLSDKDLQLIRKFNKRPSDTQDSLLEEVRRLPQRMLIQHMYMYLAMRYDVQAGAAKPSLAQSLPVSLRDAELLY